MHQRSVTEALTSDRPLPQAGFFYPSILRSEPIPGAFMQPEKVANMTVDALKELIRQVVNEELQKEPTNRKDSRSVQEIIKSIEPHRWTPPPGIATAS
jgi:hypothetical protein